MFPGGDGVLAVKDVVNAVPIADLGLVGDPIPLLNNFFKDMRLEKIPACFAQCAAPTGPCAEQNSRNPSKKVRKLFLDGFRTSPVGKGSAFVND